MQIRQDQQEHFRQDAWLRFEEEMVTHCGDFSPKHAKAVGDPQLRLAVRSGIQRAGEYGFTKRGPIRLFLELALLCGSSFDTDPQFAALSDPLRRQDEEMIRAQEMHEEHTRYAKDVPALSTEESLASLKQIAESSENAGGVPGANFEQEFGEELTEAFPERAAYSGEAGVQSLLQEGRKVAAHFGRRTVYESRIMTLLMFSFGHGCVSDPMYPWIARSLQDETMEDSARMDHLKKRMLVWVENIVGESV